MVAEEANKRDLGMQHWGTVMQTQADRQAASPCSPHSRASIVLWFRCCAMYVPQLVRPTFAPVLHSPRCASKGPIGDAALYRGHDCASMRREGVHCRSGRAWLTKVKAAWLPGRLHRRMCGVYAAMRGLSFRCSSDGRG